MLCTLDYVCKILVVMCIIIIYLLYKITVLESVIQAEGYATIMDNVNSVIAKATASPKPQAPQNLTVNDLTVIGNINAKGNINAQGNIKSDSQISAQELQTSGNILIGKCKIGYNEAINNERYGTLYMKDSNLHVDHTITTDMIRSGKGLWLGTEQKDPEQETRIVYVKKQHGGGIGMYGELRQY